MNNETPQAYFNYAMQSFRRIADNLAIGCQQAEALDIWNAMQQAKAAWQARDAEVAEWQPISTAPKDGRRV